MFNFGFSFSMFLDGLRKNSMFMEKPERAVDRVFIHCSASDNPAHDDIEVIKQWHTDKRPVGRGFSDVGYHYFITKDGRLQNGRSLEKQPAAQSGHNKGSLAICLHGLENFTEAQFKTLKLLCEKMYLVYEQKITFHGHNEVNRNKTCPVFDYKEVIGLDDSGHLK